jgi:hypothetical protein
VAQATQANFVMRQYSESLYFATNNLCLKRTFHIAPVGLTETDVLLCELSQHHIGLAWADAATRQLKGASYYELRNLPEPDKLQDVLRAEKIGLKNTNRVVIGSAFKNVLLIPHSQFSEESAASLYTTMHGSTGDPLHFDEVQPYNLVIVHAVPQGMMDVLKSAQPAEVMHVYGCGLKAANAFSAGDAVTVHFTNKEIRVMAVKEAQLKLAQTFCYTTPLDVVYYLLAVCRAHDFSQTETILLLSGMVHEDSAMYKELYQYFSKIRLWKPAAKTTLQSEYPSHFFSSLYNLAACAL